MSKSIDEVGNGQTQRIDMACKDASVCGGVAMVDQSNLLTAGTIVSHSEKSELSWRAAVI